MRIDILKAAEAEFFSIYPEGFDDPEMAAIKKRHKVAKMTEMAHDAFGKDKFGFTQEIVENMIKIVTRSSLISVFEKPKYRDYLRSLDQETKDLLAHGLYLQLHGDSEKGFNLVLDVLTLGKLAKWSLISVIPYYYYPQTEAFMKPTTVKGIVTTFELEGLIYKPRPSYSFYIEYRRQLMEMRKMVSPNLGPDNAAFSGFLMMIMGFNKR